MIFEIDCNILIYSFASVFGDYTSNDMGKQLIMLIVFLLQAFTNLINQTNITEWEVTIRFYKSLIYVEQNMLVYNSDDARINIVKSLPTLAFR